ncbi:MAG TPA: AAA family ATPase [Candidatus Ozemobacteraceae bacterium]
MSSLRSAGITALKRALVAGTPLIAISSWEEDQVLSTLASISRSVFPSEKPLTEWDLQAGITCGELNQPGTSTPEAALEAVTCSSEPGFFVFRDLVPFLGRPEVQRRLRRVATSFRGQNRFLFLLGGDIHLPPEVRKDIFLLDFGLPETAELTELIQRAFATAVRRGAENRTTPEDLSAAATALQGFTATEAQQSLTKLLWGTKVIDGTIVKQLQEEKEQLARKEGILEYVRTDCSLGDVGGLENLKNWLEKRRRLFSPEAAAAGLRPPRGLLMMGISGCGKSLSVKAISSLWNLPLFRLDMNQVYSGLHGTPEGAFHRAIKSVEAMAPAILWFDEIEGGISSSTMKDGSTGSHIFSAFLTWMQEKKADVFVAATANRIDLLPAEIIRKGRFDQVFFIDLPNDREREEIFRVHLGRRGIDVSTFDLTLLSVSTEFWNGAEIEHVVEAGMVEAFDRGEKLTNDDLYTIIRGTVPLSRTMAEQIKFIRAWASERAISASKADR